MNERHIDTIQDWCVWLVVVGTLTAFVLAMLGCSTQNLTVIVAPHAVIRCDTLGGPVSQPWRNWGVDEKWQLSTNALCPPGTPMQITISQDMAAQKSFGLDALTGLDTNAWKTIATGAAAGAKGGL